MSTAAAPKWTWPHTLGVFVLVAAIGAVPVLVPWAAGVSGAYHAARLVAWLVTLGLMLAFMLVIGHGFTGGVWRGVLIDEHYRVSTSRLQLVLWTGVVLSAYLTGVLANIGLQQHTPIAISVPQTLWVAMGVSTFSLVGAPIAIRYRRSKKADTPARHGSAQEASWRDLVSGEIAGFENTLDIGKLQMLLVTIVLVVAYGAVLGYAFYTRGTKIGYLPKVNDAFTILLAISHGGYLVKKGTPAPDKPKG